MIFGNLFSKGKSLETIALQGYVEQIKGLKLEAAKAALAEEGLNKAQQKRVLTMAGLTAAQTAELSSEEVLRIKRVISTNAEIQELVTTKQLTKEKLAEALVTDGLQKEEAELMAARYLNIGAGEKELGLLGKLGSKWSGLAATLGLTAAELGVVAGAIAILVGVGFVAWYNSIDQIIKRQQKEREEIQKNIDALHNESNEFKDKATKLEDLSKKYSEATKGSDEYYEVANQIAELSPELVVGYTDEGNAIIANTEAIEKQTQAYKDNAKAKREAAKASAEEATSSLLEQYTKAKEGKEKAENKIKKQQAEILNDRKNGNFDAIETRELDIEIQKENALKYAKEMVEIKESIRNAYLDMTNPLSEQEIAEGKDNVQKIFLDYTTSLLGTDNQMGYEEFEKQYEKIMSDYHVTNAVNKLFSVDYENLPLNEAKANIDEYLKELATYFGTNAETLRKALGFENLDDEKKKFINKFGKGANHYNASQFTNNNDFSMSDYERLNSDEYQKALDEVTKAMGRFIPESEDFEAAWQKLNETIENSSKAFSKTEMIDSINGLSDGFDKLDEIYADVKDGDVFDFTKLDTKKFEEAFSGLETEYERFIETVSSSPNDITKCQEAFNDLAQAYIDQSGILDNVTPQTAQLTEAMLENMGVTNAQVLVEQALAKAEAEEWLAKKDLTDITDDRINALFDEATASGISKMALVDLMLSEKTLSETGLNLDQQVQAILDIGAAAGVSKAKLDAMQTSFDPYAHGGGYDAAANMAEQVRQELMADFKKAKVQYSGADKSNKSGGGGDKSNENFDWIETTIKRLDEQIAKLEKTIDSAYSSLEDKNGALASKIDLTTQKINAQKQAYEAYMKAANEVPLSEEYRQLVREGGLSVEEVSDSKLKDNIKDYQEWYNKAVDMQDAIRESEKVILDSIVSMYDNELEELDYLRDNEYISEKEYVRNLANLYEKYYKNNVDLAVQAHKKKIALLKAEREYQENVNKAAQAILDYRINDLEDKKDRENEKYQKQIEIIQERINSRQDEIDAIDDEIDKLNDENDERKKALDLQKAKYELERAQNQKSQLTYTSDKGFTYKTDDSAIKDARNTLDDLKFQAQIDALEKQKKALEDIIDSYEKEITKIEELQEKSDKYYDGKIDKLNKLKNEWQQALDKEEYAKNIALFDGEFGDGSWEKLLAGQKTFINSWKQNYLDVLAAIDLANGESISKTTEHFAKLTGLTVNMDAARNKAEELKQEYDALGEASDQVGEKTKQSAQDAQNAADMTKEAADKQAEASAQVTQASDNIDTSNMQSQIADAGASANATSTQVQGIVEKLNGLATEASNISIPALNSSEFATSIGEIIGKLEELKGRFSTISDEIKGSWNNMIGGIVGTSSSGNGDPLAGGSSSNSYSGLFTPLEKEIDSANLIIDGKLKELQGLWTQFQGKLAGIIGVGEGSSDSGSQSGVPSISLNAGESKGKGSDKGKESKSESSGADTIIGAIQTGGEMIDQSLNTDWIGAFQTFGSTLNEICQKIVACVNEMAEKVVEACIKAIEAINKANAAKNSSSSNNSKPPKFEGSAYVGQAFAKGSEDIAVDKDQTVLLNELGEEGIIRDGKLNKVIGGAQFHDVKKGDIILNHKQMKELETKGKITSGNKHGKLVGSFANGTILRPLQQGDQGYNLIKIAEQLKDKVIGNMIPSIDSINRNVEMLTKNISNIRNNSQQIINTIENVNITCPGITSDDVAKQIGTALMKEFSGMSLNAYQKMNVTR